MSLIHWNSEMSVGIPSIDAQHQRLVEMLNELHGATYQGKGHEVVGDTLTGLMNYTIEHFAYEEKLFQETSYPDAEAHAAEHATLTRKVMDIHEKFKSGVTTALTQEVLLFLVNWVMDHTMDSDKKYSAHLIAAGVR